MSLMRFRHSLLALAACGLAASASARTHRAATPEPTPYVAPQAAAPLDVSGVPGLLSATVQDLAAPLAAYLQASGGPSLSLAAGGFRELTTGERSPLCDHLDKDLTDRLRDDTPYGVPSELELADAWVSVGGNAADMTDPLTLARFGRILGVQVVVSGTYVVQGASVTVTARANACSDGGLLWTRTYLLPKASLDRADLENYAGSAPPGYGKAPAAVRAPASLAGPAGAPASAAAPAEPVIAEAPQGVALIQDVHETEFSPYRVNLSLGYEDFLSSNPTFRALVPSIAVPYVSVNWADILGAEFYLWYVSSLPTLSTPVSNLFTYGMKLRLEAPLRVGHHLVLHAGVGGRFESINLSTPLAPSSDNISVGNNAFFVTAGAKAHLGPWGVEAAVDDDLVANFTTYWAVHLGLYYEYEFR